MYEEAVKRQWEADPRTPTYRGPLKRDRPCDNSSMLQMLGVSQTGRKGIKPSSQWIYGLPSDLAASMAAVPGNALQLQKEHLECIQFTKIKKVDDQDTTVSSFDESIVLGKGADTYCGLLTVTIIGGHSVVVLEWHNPEGPDTEVRHLLFKGSDETKAEIKSWEPATHEEEEEYKKSKSVPEHIPFVLGRVIEN